MAYGDLAAQRSMALDRVRNSVYDRALQQLVTPESVVLDLGSGVGIFGLLAARHGARHVYCVEPQEIGGIVLEVAAANGWADRVTFLQGRIHDVELPEQLDLVVSAMTGNLLFNEDLLPTVFHARDEHLKPGGALVPDAAAIDATPVAAPGMIARHLDSWARPHLGVDLSVVRRYAANAIVFRTRGLREAEPLGEITEVISIDLSTATYEGLDAHVTLRATAAGTCDGIAAWMRIRLGDEWLSTGPFDEPVHWSPAFIPVDPPVELEPGDEIGLRLTRPLYGEWAWRAEIGSELRQGSTFFARPLGPKRRAASRDDFEPLASERGRAVSRVLAAMDGEHTVRDLVEIVAREFPRLFPGEAQRRDFVRRLVRSRGRSLGDEGRGRRG